MLRPGSNAINLGNPVNRSATLNSGLVGWWLALPGYMSSNTMRDLCGRSPATFSGNAFWASAAGRPGGWGSFDLDGSGDYLTTTPTGFTTSTQSGVLSCWVYPRSVGAAFDSLIHNRTGGGAAALYLWDDTSMNITFSWDNDPNEYRANTGLVPVANTWNWIGLSIGANSAAIGMWNSSVGWKTYSDSNTNGAINLAIATDFGRDSALGGREIDGRMDDIRMHVGVTFSLDQMYALFQASRMGYINELNRISRPIGVKAAAGSAFKAAWARRSNQVIGVTGAA